MTTTSAVTACLLTISIVSLTGIGCRDVYNTADKETATKNNLLSTPSTLTPIPGFKIYQNTKDKFVLQYPETWNLRENNLNTIVSILSPLISKTDTFAENINIVSEQVGSNDMTLDQYYALSEANLKKYFNDFKLLRNEKTTLSDLPARMVVYYASQNNLKLRTTQIFTLKDGTAFIITLTNLQTEPNQNMEEMLKMISSFTFLK